MLECGRISTKLSPASSAHNSFALYVAGISIQFTISMPPVVYMFQRISASINLWLSYGFGRFPNQRWMSAAHRLPSTAFYPKLLPNLQLAFASFQRLSSRFALSNESSPLFLDLWCLQKPPLVCLRASHRSRKGSLFCIILKIFHREKFRNSSTKKVINKQHRLITPFWSGLPI